MVRAGVTAVCAGMTDSSPPFTRRCRRRPAAASSALGEAANKLMMLVSEPTVSGGGHPIVAIEGNAPEPPTASAQDPPTAGRGTEALSRGSARRAQIERFVQAVKDSDMAAA